MAIELPELRNAVYEGEPKDGIGIALTLQRTGPRLEFILAGHIKDARVNVETFVGYAMLASYGKDVRYNVIAGRLNESILSQCGYVLDNVQLSKSVKELLKDFCL